MQAAACPVTTAAGKPGLPDTRSLQSQPDCPLLSGQAAHSVVRRGPTRFPTPAHTATMLICCCDNMLQTQAVHKGTLVWLARALYLLIAQMPLKLEADLGGPRVCPIPVIAQYLTFTCPALVELKGEDDVILILAELTDEAFGLAQLEGENMRKKQLNAHLPGK